MLAAPDRQKSTGRLRTSSSELSELMAQLAPGGFQLGGFQLLHLGVGQPASVQILLCPPKTEQERGDTPGGPYWQSRERFGSGYQPEANAKMQG